MVLISCQCVLFGKDINGTSGQLIAVQVINVAVLNALTISKWIVSLVSLMAGKCLD